MKKLLLVLPLVLAVAIPAAAGGKTFLGNCTPGDPAQYKPHRILLACGDGALFVNHIKWSSWRARSARGRGRAHVNNCKPSCAGGKFHAYRARLKLRHRTTCSIGPKRQFLRVV